MAGFKGFGYTSPAEIITATRQGFQKALQSGNPDQMRAAIAQQAAFNLGGSAELREAQKKKKVLTESFDAVGKSGDEVQDQINFYAEVQRRAAEAELPDIVLQATENLSTLRIAQEERARLKKQDEVAAAEEKRRQEAHEQDLQDAKLDSMHSTEAVIYDPETGADRGTIDLLSPDAGDKIKEARANGFVITSMDNYIDLTEAEKDRMARLRAAAKNPVSAGRSTLYKEYMQQSRRDNNFIISADRMVDVLVDPQAASTFAFGGQSAAGLQRAGTHATSVLKLINPNEDLRAQIEQRFQEDERFNALDNERQAMVLNLGYALATSREGGRLTDQDVERAIISLGLDNPDSRAVAYTFGRALAEKRQQVLEGLSLSGVADIPDAQNAQRIVLENLDNTINRLQDSYELDFSKDTALDIITGARGGDPDDVSDVRMVTEDGTEIIMVSP